MDTASRLIELNASHADRVAANELMRWLSAKTETRGATHAAFEHFESRWPSASLSTSIRLAQKAAVGVGTTTDATWAQPLVAPSAAPLLTLVQQESLIGRVAFQRVPFATPIPAQTSLGSFAWVSENSAKPAGKIDWSSTTLAPAKVAGIVVLSAELVKLAQPGSENVMRTALTSGLAIFLDRQLLDPAVAAVAGRNPASLTNGVTPLAATASLPADVQKLLGTLYAARPTAKAVLIATPAVVSALAGSAFTVVNNQPHYAGVPIYASSAAGSLVVAADATAVLVAMGALELDVSTQASVELNDAPTNPPVAATTFVSFFQTDLRGFRVEQAASWTKLTGAVQTLTVA